MNKPRLIDANKLLRHLSDWWLSETPGGEICFIGNELRRTPIMHTLETFMNIVESQPTAYDIDKVVERLESLETYRQTVTMEKHPFCASEIETVSKKKAIEIVKGNYSENPNSSDQFTDADKMGGGAG